LEIKGFKGIYKNMGKREEGSGLSDTENLEENIKMLLQRTAGDKLSREAEAMLSPK
jgi:hypothetical protein